MNPGKDGCGWQRSACHCIKDCADINDNDFQKIVELEDAGVALYRYVPPDLDPTQNIGEVFILRKDDDVDLEPDEFNLTFARNKISCPRCINLIEKAEKLFNERPSVKQQDVEGVCDHCWKPVAKMQRLAELARKKRNVLDPAAIEALKAQMQQIIGTEESKKRYKGPKQRPTTPIGPRPQFDRKPIEVLEREQPEKAESRMSHELSPSAKERRDKTHTEKIKEEKQKVKEDKLEEKEDKTKDKDKSKGKEGKTKNQGDKEEKIKGKSKDQEDKTKDKDKKSKDGEGKSKDKEEKDGDGLKLQQQLAQMEKEKQEAMKLRKQQDQERELAEKKAKEAERLKQLEHEKNKVPVKVLKPISPKSNDAEDDEVISELAVFKAPPVKDIIIGEEICKNVRRTHRNEDVQNIEKEERGKKAQTPKSLIARKVPVSEAEKNDKARDIDKANNKANNKANGDKPNENKPRQLSKDIGQQDAKKTGKGNKSSKSTSETSGTTKSTTSVKQKTTHTNTKTVDGVIRYALSDRTFIDKGWTKLPIEKVVRKMNVYRMRPAQPEFDWFEHNKNRRQLDYDTGGKLAEIDDNGRGRWYYRSGQLAMDYYDAEEINAGQRFVVYSTGTPDERGRPRPRTVLATFDHLGNGIVFDHTGKIRLKYNQTEGVVLDRELGPVSHWKWHTLNDPPVLQQVMIDTQLSHKDSTIMSMNDPGSGDRRADDDAMLAIEFDNFIKEKTKKSSQAFRPFQIKMKALKINEHFSLRVLDQATVYLLFRDGTANIKINIGMVLDHKEIVDTDTAEVGEVSNKMTKLPACTNSLGELQKAIAQARTEEGLRALRERRLRGAAPSASADAMRAAAARPLRAPLACRVTSHIRAPASYEPCSCDCFKNPLF